MVDDDRQDVPDPPFRSLPVRLETLSPVIYAPNAARRLRGASVLWLNDRWFGEAGIDLARDGERDHVERWLLATYGVSIPSPHEPDDLYVGPPRTLGADRYGGTGGTVHGGSGRCLFASGFNVKGAGRTSLVSDATDWYHSHGCLWLEEAIRESLYSELAARVFPGGAVPVIAILDAGAGIYWDDGSIGERRALVVRPNFVRLAHLQRSLFFGSAGHPGSEQHLDALKCRDVAEAVWRNGAASPSTLEIAERIGRQIGFARFHRLWPGPFFSSNFTLDGQLVDFGSFRSMPDWKRRQGAVTDLPFGDEHLGVLPTLHSLSFAASRVGAKTASGEHLNRAYYDAVNAEFDRSARVAFGFPPSSQSDMVEAFTTLLRLRYRQEQAMSVGSSAAAENPIAEEFRQAGSPLSMAYAAALASRSGKPQAATAPLPDPDRIFGTLSSLSRENVQSGIETLLGGWSDDETTRRHDLGTFIESRLMHWMGHELAHVTAR